MTPPAPKTAAACGPHLYLIADVRRFGGATQIIVVCSRCGSPLRVEVPDGR